MKQSQGESSPMRQKRGKTTAAALNLAGRKSLTKAMSVVREQKRQGKGAKKSKMETVKRRVSKVRKPSAARRKRSAGDKAVVQPAVLDAPPSVRCGGEPIGTENGEESGSPLRKQPRRRNKAMKSELADVHFDEPSASKKSPMGKMEKILNVVKEPPKKGKGWRKQPEVVPTGAARALLEENQGGPSGSKMNGWAGTKPEELLAVSLRQQPDRKCKSQGKSVPLDEGTHPKEKKGDAYLFPEEDNIPSTKKYFRKTKRLMNTASKEKPDE